MSKIVLLLEEPSMKEALQGLLPKILPPEVHWQAIPHEGKRDLEGSIPRKLRGWREPGVRFIVMRDQDQAPCLVLKNKLLTLCQQAFRPDSMVRIVCHELESWFLGDLKAVGQAYDLPDLHTLQDKRKFKDPDHLSSPYLELKKLVKDYQKVSGARAIGPRLDPDNNRSKSFQVFIQGIRRIVEQELGKTTRV